MTPGSILSGIFHIALALLVVFGLPSFMKPLPEPEMPSTVEVVTLAPKATAPELTKPPAPKLPDPPKPEVKQEPTPPTPPPQAAAEPPKPEPPKPEPPKPEPPKAAEAPKPEPKPEPLPEPIKKKEEPKKEEPKPEPPKAAEVKKPEPPKKPEKDRFESVLDSVLKNKAPVRPRQPEQPAKPVQQAAVPQQRQTAPNLSDQLARSELDAVREKVRPCWNFPAGAPNPEKLAVEIQVQMNPNGMVREASIYDRSRMNDPFYRAAAEAALRAALNPACQPFPLPPQKYNSWRTFTFIFDPRDL